MRALGTGVAVMALAALPAAGAELSIRNLTETTVRFRLASFPSAEDGTHALGPGEILRLPGDEAYDISFRSGDRVREYRLDPGGNYTLRYDHADEVDLFLGSHGREDAPDLAPYVATPMPVVRRMLEMAEVGAEDYLIDLGCGDGRIVVEAAKRGARGLGVDLDPQRIRESRQLAAREGVEERVAFRVEDAMTTDLTGVTVLALYLLPESNALLRPILERDLAPGTRIVTHNYEVPGWTAVSGETMRDSADTLHFLYLYVLDPPEAEAPQPDVRSLSARKQLRLARRDPGSAGLDERSRHGSRAGPQHHAVGETRRACALSETSRGASGGIVWSSRCRRGGPPANSSVTLLSPHEEAVDGGEQRLRPGGKVPGEIDALARVAIQVEEPLAGLGGELLDVLVGSVPGAAVGPPEAWGSGRRGAGEMSEHDA